MSIKLKCDTCGKNYSVPDNLAGKQGKCRCGTTIRIHGCSIANPSIAIIPKKPDLTGGDKIQKTKRITEPTLSPKAQANVAAILIFLVCPIFLMRGCIVVNHPTLSEEDKKRYAESNYEIGMAIQARDMAKEEYKYTENPAWKRAAKNLDENVSRAFRSEPKDLGTPRVGEAFLTFLIAAICLGGGIALLFSIGHTEY